jgi:hypothetical protein
MRYPDSIFGLPQMHTDAMMPESSWRLKMKRALNHFNELQRLVEQYDAGKHYRAVGVAPDDGDPTHWRFVLEITEQPDPEIAIVLGDCLFNIRSGLDHIAVACAPANRRRSAGFPILNDPGNEEEMERYASQTQGMTQETVAAIEFEQSYNMAKRAPDARPRFRRRPRRLECSPKCRQAPEPGGARAGAVASDCTGVLGGGSAWNHAAGVP